MRALAGSGAREPAMRQELRLSQELQTALVRLLEQEQRPLMIMTQRQVARLVARRAQTADVLRLGGANLALYLRRVAADNPAVELVEP